MKHDNWLTEIGVRNKPDKCKACPYAAVGKGFCGDWVPENPLAAFVFDVPTKDDILEQNPLSGAQGYIWRKLLLDELGYGLEDVIISSTLRCCPPNNKFGKPEYPTAWLGKQAELRCRQYDDAIIKFDPNVFVLTLHPRTIHTIGAHKVQIQRDVTKAFSFAKRGYRPAILFGEGACELYAPFIKNNGGLKSWRGHWYTGYSPFKEFDEEKINKRRFAEG